MFIKRHCTKSNPFLFSLHRILVKNFFQTIGENLFSPPPIVLCRYGCLFGVTLSNPTSRLKVAVLIVSISRKSWFGIYLICKGKYNI